MSGVCRCYISCCWLLVQVLITPLAFAQTPVDPTPKSAPEQPLADKPPIEIYSYYIPGLVNSETDGSLVELLDAVERLSGIDFKLVIVPTMRAQKLFKHGRIAAYYPVLEEHRHHPSCRTSNILTKQIVVFTRAGEPIITQVQQLHGKVVGAVAGYTYGQSISDNPAIKIEYTDNDDVNLRKLLAGRIDAVIGDAHSTVNAVNIGALKNTVSFDVSQPINVLDVFFSFQPDPDNEALCDEVSVALEQLREQGELYKWFRYR